MKGVLFDLDGTLIDSVGDLAIAAETALTELGYPPRKLEEIKSFVGNGAYKLAERMLPAGKATEENTKELLAAYLKCYEESCIRETRPYADIPQVLSELKARGYRLGVVSNKPDKLTKHIVSHFFNGLFDVAEGQKEGVPLKPDPTLANEVIQRLGLEEGKYYFIGDSGEDMRTAKNCGATGIGVLWGYRREEDIRSGGAAHVVKTPLKILDIVVSLD